MTDELDQEMLDAFDGELRDYLEHGEVAQAQVDALVDASLAELGAGAVVATSVGAVASKSAGAATSMWWVGAASALVAAAAYLLVPSSEAVTDSNPGVELPAMEMVLVSGQVSVGSKTAQLGPLARGSVVATERGHACMAMRGQGDFCARADSQVELDPTGRPLLREGTLLAALDGGLALAAGERELTGAGARFALTRLSEGFRLEVSEAPVRVAAGDDAWTVQPGQWLEWTGQGVQARGDSSRDTSSAQFALLGLDAMWEAPLLGRTSISLDPEVERGEVRMDGRLLGLAPVRAYLPEGVHHLELVAAGYDAHEGDFELRAGEEHSIVAQLRQRAEVAELLEDEVLDAASVPAVEDPREETRVETPAEDLLALARAAMKERRWSDAVRAYRRLRRAHPRGDLAHAALVSIGNLELEHLGSPERARRAYAAYLRRPGALAQEARWGLVRASKGKAEERKVIEDYLRRYRSSPEARELQQRLVQLDKGR